MKFVLSPFGLVEDPMLIAKWSTDSHYANFFQSIGMIPTMEECRNYPGWTGNSVMMIRSATTAETMGVVSMYRPIYRNGTVEAGILIDKKYQGNKLGERAGLKWISYLASLGFRKIIVNIIEEKLQRRLLENGFVLEGVHKDEVNIDGQYVDEYRMAYTVRK